MEDLTRTPQSDHEPTPPEVAPVTNTPLQQVPAGLSSGGCLKDASIALGILSIIASVLMIVTVVSFYATHHRVYGSYGASTLELLVPFMLWLPFGALPGVFSCICAAVYGTRDPSKRGSATWPILIGVLALGLGLVVVVLASSPM